MRVEQQYGRKLLMACIGIGILCSKVAVIKQLAGLLFWVGCVYIVSRSLIGHFATLR